MKTRYELHEAENGFILKRIKESGEETEYIFTTVEKLAAWFKEHFKRKEKPKDDDE
jgi:hypothetical protein